MIRKFRLINGEGVSWDLNARTSFFHSIGGFGYKHPHRNTERLLHLVDESEWHRPDEPGKGSVVFVCVYPSEKYPPGHHTL